MGGRGSGGLRPGSGRKPEDAVPMDGPLPVVPMPDDLTSAERAVWMLEEREALQNRTLVPATAAAFRELCQQIVFRDTLKAQIDKDGLTYLKVTVDGSGQEHTELKKHPLLSEYRGTCRDIAAARTAFRLRPIGKPMPVAQAEKPKSALETLQASRPGLRAVQ